MFAECPMVPYWNIAVDWLVEQSQAVDDWWAGLDDLQQVKLLLLFAVGVIYFGWLWTVSCCSRRDWKINEQKHEIESLNKQIGYLNDELDRADTTACTKLGCTGGCSDSKRAEQGGMPSFMTLPPATLLDTRPNDVVTVALEALGIVDRHAQLEHRFLRDLVRDVTLPLMQEVVRSSQLPPFDENDILDEVRKVARELSSKKEAVPTEEDE